MNTFLLTWQPKHLKIEDHNLNKNIKIYNFKYINAIYFMLNKVGKLLQQDGVCERKIELKFVY